MSEFTYRLALRTFRGGSVEKNHPVYTPEGYVGGQPYFLVENVFLRNTLAQTPESAEVKDTLCQALFIQIFKVLEINL